MSAIQQQERHPFYFAALREADECDVPAHDREAFVWQACTAMAVRAYNAETAPLVKAKVRAMVPFLGDSISTADGQLIRSPPKYPPEVVELLAILDQAIARIAERYRLFDTSVWRVVGDEGVEPPTYAV